MSLARFPEKQGSQILRQGADPSIYGYGELLLRGAQTHNVIEIGPVTTSSDGKIACPNATYPFELLTADGTLALGAGSPSATNHPLTINAQTGSISLLGHTVGGEFNASIDVQNGVQVNDVQLSASQLTRSTDNSTFTVGNTGTAGQTDVVGDTINVGTVGSTVSIPGNVILGSVTTNVETEDKEIELAKGATAPAGIDGAGLRVDTSSVVPLPAVTPALNWRGTSAHGHPDTWEFTGNVQMKDDAVVYTNTVASQNSTQSQGLFLTTVDNVADDGTPADIGPCKERGSYMLVVSGASSGPCSVFHITKSQASAANGSITHVSSSLDATGQGVQVVWPSNEKPQLFHSPLGASAQTYSYNVSILASDIV